MEVDNINSDYGPTNNQSTRTASEERRFRDKEAKKDKIQNETQEQRTARLARLADKARERREAETQEQRITRLSKNAAAVRKHRAKLSETEKITRRATSAANDAHRRDNETTEQTTSRRAKDKISHAQAKQQDKNRPKRTIFTTENDIKEHYLGPMIYRCTICQAKHFKGEMNSRKTFKSCCYNGHVLLDPPEYPALLRDLMSNTQHPFYNNFRQNIRSFNSALSFASMGANLEDLSGLKFVLLIVYFWLKCFHGAILFMLLLGFKLLSCKIHDIINFL